MAAQASQERASSGWHTIIGGRGLLAWQANRPSHAAYAGVRACLLGLRGVARKARHCTRKAARGGIHVESLCARRRRRGPASCAGPYGML